MFKKKNYKKIHMIGNAHIDPVWVWRWQEGYQETRATFKSALDRLEENSEFIFTCSSVALYKWIEESEPEIFEKIKFYVKRGKWCIVGGWWIEPDCNIPGGESLVRQGLYGQRYLLEKFGKTATVGYNIDSFGHAGSIPQILKKSGLDYYIFMRPGSHEKELPGPLFTWEGIDGTKVLAYRIPISYVCWDKELESRINDVADLATQEVPELMCFYGVGNHGGGPTRENLVRIERIIREDSPFEVCFSSPDKYFAAVDRDHTDYPLVKDDLQHHASGCYSVLSEIKKFNRKAEESLIAAEKFASMASLLLGRHYEKEKLQSSWEDVLFNQFHDILAGTSIKEAYEDARNLHGRAMQIASEITNGAIQAISYRVNRSKENTCIIVFNPHSWRYNGPIECELQGSYEEHQMVDDSGNFVPSQLIQPYAIMDDFRSKVAFVADIPSMGYATYTMVKGAEEKIDTALQIGQDVMENEYIRLQVDPSTGYFSSIYDKVNDCEVLKGPGGVPRVYVDTSDTWSHGVYSFKDVDGAFTNASVRVIEKGPVRGGIRVESEYGGSHICQDIILYAGNRYIECRVRINWQESHKLLKFEFPVNIKEPTATYEIPYGYMERPADGEEEPGQRWCDVSGHMESTTGERKLYGVSLLNDSKYSFDIDNEVMSITALRSPVYAHHNPAELNRANPGDYLYIDQGIQEFTYRVFPHAGLWKEASIVQCAQELNSAPVSVVETSGAGDLPSKESFIDVDADNVIVSVFKKGEDDGWILRCYETEGREGYVKISVNILNKEFCGVFKPFEIKTLKVSEYPEVKVEEVNLLEFKE